LGIIAPAVTIQKLHSGSGAQVEVLAFFEAMERCFGKVVEARLLFGVATEPLS
jgi:hypothetical protein